MGANSMAPWRDRFASEAETVSLRCETVWTFLRSERSLELRSRRRFSSSPSNRKTLAPSTMVNPNEVERTSRKVGYAVFFTLVAAFIAYSIVTVISAVNKRDNPPTTSKLVRKTFALPIFTVCAQFDMNVTFDSAGCQAQLGSTTDVNGDPVDGGGCSVDYIQDFDDNCVELNRNRNITLRTRKDSLEAFIEFSYDASNAGTGIDGIPKAFFFYFRDDVNQPFYLETPEILPFPGVTSISLQRQEFTFLEKSKNYAEYSTTQINSELITSSALADNDTFSTMLLSIRLASLNVELVEEVDPLNPNVLVGVISGFWGLVGIAWGIIFVPRTTTPLRPRWRKDKPAPATDVEEAGEPAKKDQVEMAAK
jgi:hypothetical protein